MPKDIRATESHRERIIRIARLQQTATWVFLGLLGVHFLVLFNPWLAGAATFGGLLFLFKIVQMMRAIGARRAWLILGICALLLPLLQLVVLVVVNYQASDILRAAGLRVGALGVSDEELERFTNAD